MWSCVLESVITRAALLHPTGAMEDSQGENRERLEGKDIEDNKELDWISGLGASSNSSSNRGQTDPFALQAADPFAHHVPPSGAAEQGVDPFADLLQLSFSRESPGRGIPATAGVASSASRRPASSAPEVAATTGERMGVRVIDPLAASGESSLAAKKRKSQESRQKRDEFLNQMSSFLQGIETNADVVPPEAPSYLVDIGMGRNPTSTVAPPATSIAHEASSWSGVEGRGNVADDLSLWPSVGKVGNRGASSSLMQEDVSDDDIFSASGRGASATDSAKRPTGDLGEFLGSGVHPHPRGSLFDDIDVAPDEAPASPCPTSHPATANVVESESAASVPRRMAPSLVATSSPFQDARPVSNQVHAKPKSKNSRGLDLEEVRRRTSLLSGGAESGGRTSPPARGPSSSEPRPFAPRPSETASLYSSGGAWRQQQSAQRSSSFGGGFAPHPLHAESPADPLFGEASGRSRGALDSSGSYDNRGNYFNEDLLLARAKGNGATGSSGSLRSDPLEGGQEGAAGGEGGQGAWGGDALMDTAGNFLTSAREGAKTLLRDAKTGVGAVGASIGTNWQKQQHEGDGGTFNQRSTSRPNRDQERQPRDDDKKYERNEDYEITFGEGRFGFTLAREENGPRKGKGVVCKVHPQGTAQNLGVRLGDIVTGVNKRRYDNYDDVMDVLPKLPRPVLVSFKRGDGAWAALPATSGVRSTPPSQQTDLSGQAGGNPLEWLAKLNPFDKSRREEEEAARKRDFVGATGNASSQEWTASGEAVAKGLGGGIFSWSYYGTSDGVEPNTRDTYTEHVMRCQWGPSADRMKSWMVARRYREFDALDMDLRDAYPDRRDAIPRLPPKEFFKMAPDVVERRAKGLETYMATIIQRFPDMLECSHLDRFLTISERISTMEASSATGVGNDNINKHHITLGAHGSSSNVFASPSAPPLRTSRGTSSSYGLVGTDFILNLMTSEDAYRLAQEKRPVPVVVSAAEDMIAELEDHLSSLSPTAHLLSDTKLYDLVDRAQQCWPRIKAAAAAAVAGEPPSGSEQERGSGEGYSEALLPRVLQCDEGMERAFDHLRACLASRGYINAV